MKPPDVALRELVLQWLDKAAADFDAAEQLSAQGGRFREIIAFHCQQAVEKYLKALLTLVRTFVEAGKTQTGHVSIVTTGRNRIPCSRRRDATFGCRPEAAW